MCEAVVAEGRLWDHVPQSSTEVPIKLEISGGSVYVYPKGYGNTGSEDGHGCPIMLEIWRGELRVVVWANINQEDPTHIISLEGALELLRKKD